MPLRIAPPSGQLRGATGLAGRSPAPRGWVPSGRAAFTAAAEESPQGPADAGVPDRDGGRSASTSSPAAPAAPQMKLRMRPAGARDWLVLLDDAALAQGIGKAARDQGVPPTAPAAGAAAAEEEEDAEQQRPAAADAEGAAPARSGTAGAQGVGAHSAWEAASLAALLSAVEPRCGEMAPADVAAALEAAAKLAQQARGGGGGRGRAALDRLSALLLARHAQLGAAASPPADLARLVHACGRLHKAGARGDWRGAALAAAPVLQPCLGNASMAELTRLVWAFATLRAAPPAPWLDAFFRATQAGLASCTPGQAALTAWALARLAQPPPAPWLASLLEETGPKLGAATPQDMANLTWALGTWRVPRGGVPDAWLAALYRASAPRLPSMAGEALSQLAWGLGRLRVAPPPAWCDALAAAAAARCAAPPGLTALQAVNVVWALGEWRHRPAAEDMAALAAATAALCLAPGAGGTPNDHATLLWAAGRLGYLPDEAWLDAWLGAAGAAMAAGRYGPPHYVTAALMLGRWGVVPAAAWRDAFFRSSGSRLRAFTPQQLGNLLWGLGRVDAPVPVSWLAAAVDAAAAKLPGTAGPADAGRLLGGLARLRPMLPPERAAVARGGAAGEDGGDFGGEGGPAASEAGAGAAPAPSGLSLWAADNAAPVSLLLAGLAPAVARCGPREVATVARAAAALRLTSPPREFVAALSDAADGAGGGRGGEGGAAEFLAAARDALAQLQAGSR